MFYLKKQHTDKGDEFTLSFRYDRYVHLIVEHDKPLSHRLKALTNAKRALIKDLKKHLKIMGPRT